MTKLKKYAVLWASACVILSGCSGNQAQGTTFQETETQETAVKETTDQEAADTAAKAEKEAEDGSEESGRGKKQREAGEGQPDRDRGNNAADGENKQGNRAGGPGGGRTAVETDPNVLAVIEEGSEKFTQLTFKDEETGISLEYSLYVPEDYDENEKYPFIMFIPDSSGAGKSAKEIVEQYYGADIWVSEEEQEKHKSFVLVPAFSEVVVDDDWNTSDQIETAVKLVNALTEEYSIDTDRMYTTGQSMGCMTSLYLCSTHPELFTAYLFVSGQWDISNRTGV